MGKELPVISFYDPLVGLYAYTTNVNGTGILKCVFITTNRPI